MSRGGQMRGARRAETETYQMDRRGSEHRATKQMAAAAAFQQAARQPAAGIAGPDRPDHDHPNEFDCRRIARLLENRRRYRYVEPRVVPIPNGYRIESPCCSRNVDPAGVVIDIALIEHCSDQDPWALYRKVHPEDTWIIDSRHPSLTAV